MKFKTLLTSKGTCSDFGCSENQNDTDIVYDDERNCVMSICKCNDGFDDVEGVCGESSQVLILFGYNI